MRLRMPGARARALDLEARVLILDEPTSSLSPSEATSLLEVLAGLKIRGIGVIYISHRLEEIEHAQLQLDNTLDAIEHARLRLDSIRLIVEGATEALL